MFTVSTFPEKCLNCESRYDIYHYKIELHKIYKFISSNVKSKKVDIWKENVHMCECESGSQSVPHVTHSDNKK